MFRFFVVVGLCMLARFFALLPLSISMFLFCGSVCGNAAFQ